MITLKLSRTEAVVVKCSLETQLNIFGRHKYYQSAKKMIEKIVGILEKEIEEDLKNATNPKA